MISVSLCLSDIDKQFIKKGKNGKFYVSLLVDRRLSTGQYGETHTVKINKTEQERAIDSTPKYCGSGKAMFEVSDAELSRFDWLGESEHLPDSITPEEKATLRKVYFAIKKRNEEREQTQVAAQAEQDDSDLPF
mgnify:FL=1